MFTIYSELHIKSDVDRLHLSWKERGIGFIFIEDCAQSAIRGLEVHLHSSDEQLIQEATGDKIGELEGTTILKT